jgi:predicted dehydrogenase
VDIERREQLAKAYGCQSAEDWKSALDDPSVDAVIVSTPNGYTAEIAIAALSAGKHVLVEKPPGRNLAEARRLADAARKANRVLKVGFNHRYHPALSRAHELFSTGTIGRIINVRACYGHGGRPGYEKEWRGNPDLAGGGELTDQGVHIADLIHWFIGLPSEAFAFLQTIFWPIKPLEDNAFGLFRCADGVVASLHTSWTQWKNLFSFEVFGKNGSLSIEGLGGSYGTERLVVAVRNPAGGVAFMKEETFGGPDLSWELEWRDFVNAVTERTAYWGAPEDGVAAMSMIDALYRSARSGAPEPLGSA